MFARREALKIANQEWEAVDTDLNREDYQNFQAYVEEKIGLAKQATGVKNMGGFIVQSVRENYQDPTLQAALEQRKAKEREGMLDALESEMLEKRNALLRQAVRADPELLVQASAKIQSYIVRQRLGEVQFHRRGLPKRAGWSRRRSTPFSPKNSAPSSSRRSMKYMRRRKRGSLNSFSPETGNYASKIRR